MSKLKKINLNGEVLNDILDNVIKKVPGISNTLKPTIEISHSTIPFIKITIKPMDDIVNVYNLCKRLQDLVYYHILTNLDLDKIRVDVVAI